LDETLILFNYRRLIGYAAAPAMLCPSSHLFLKTNLYLHAGQLLSGEIIAL
jgi:hypothetical protein